MPPKKNANKTPATPKHRQEMSAKKKPLQVKPKLKTPSIIKVKIAKKNLAITPNANGITSNTKTATKLTKRQIVFQKNLDLTNAVALAQLVKDCPVKIEPDQEVNAVKKKGPDQKVKIVKKRCPNLEVKVVKKKGPDQEVKVAKKKGPDQEVKFAKKNGPDQEVKVIKKRGPDQEVKVVKKRGPDQEVKVVKKRGRRKKSDQLVPVENGLENVEKALENPEDAPISVVTASYDSEAAFEIPQKKKRGRKPQLKRNQELEAQNTVKEEDETPPIINPVSKKRKWTQSKITDLKICFRRNSSSSVQSKKNNSRTVKVTNRKPKLVRTMMMRGKKSVENTPASECQSPSILDQAVQQPNDSNVSDLVAKKEVNETETCKSPSTASCAVESRKTSMTSTSECMSWTKDISTSSTTTCITASSSDFVLINNKLPTLKLTNIEVPQFKKPPSDKNEESLSDSESSNDSTKCVSNTASVVPEVDCHSLNLSTSSISNTKSISNNQENNRVNTMNNSVSKISKALDKLSLNLKKIDLEIINWIGYPNEDIDFNCNKIKEKIFKVLEEETNVIVKCQQIERVLSDDEPVREQESTVEKKRAKEQTQDDDKFVKPSDVIVTKSVTNSKTLSTEKCRAAEQSRPRSTSHSEKVANYSFEDNNFTSNNLYASDQTCDDDDALSLFAESITGMESSRRNSTMGSPPRTPPHTNTDDFEEYVPQPVIPNLGAETMTKKLTYNPTKIVNDDNEPAHSVKTIVCEKQNADSTSLNKDSIDQVDRPHTDVGNITKFPIPHWPDDKISPSVISPSAADINKVQWKREPSLLVDFIPQQTTLKSVTLERFCFSHVAAVCANYQCKNSHVRPNTADIKAMLCTLNNNQLINEYIIYKNWKALRTAYGPCFIEECKRRRMTRSLIEMVIDIVVKADTQDSQEDAQLKLQVLEYSLLYLNTVNLATVEGLLMFSIKGVLLCDMYMQTIAETQNFSRFKTVFIKLTRFIIDHDKTFSSDVASQLLERIAILPYEESVTRAAIDVIEHTEPVIFNNSMMRQFENRLSASNLELYRTLLSIKDKTRVPARFQTHAGNVPCVRSPQFSATSAESQRTTSPLGPPPFVCLSSQPGVTPLYSDRDKRYTSPDTTHLDNVGKPTEEPIITRTINFDLSKSYTTPNFNGSNSSESADDFLHKTPQPTAHFQRWRGRGAYRFRGPGFFPPGNRGFAPRVRGTQFRMKRPMDRQVTYGSSPSKFPRFSGPDFF